MKYAARFYTNGEVTFSGMDTGKMQVVGFNPEARTISIREDGHSYWTGIGMPRSYAPAQFKVFTYEKIYGGTPAQATLTEIARFPASGNDKARHADSAKFIERIKGENG